MCASRAACRSRFYSRSTRVPEYNRDAERYLVFYYNNTVTERREKRLAIVARVARTRLISVSRSSKTPVPESSRLAAY